jgi:hypothetical protein
LKTQVNSLKKGCISNKGIIFIILLFASTLFIFNLLFSQFSDDNINNNAYAESAKLIDNTSGNNAPNFDIFNITTGYTIEPVVWNLTAPDTYI